MTKALGMNYPIAHGQQGYFEQTFESLANEKVKLINLLRTVEGERYMQPSFGLSIYKYIFEPLTENLITKIENDIRNKVEFWLPNLIINDLLVDVIMNSNKIYIEINFSLKNAPDDYDVVTFAFDIKNTI